MIVIDLLETLRTRLTGSRKQEDTADANPSRVLIRLRYSERLPFLVQPADERDRDRQLHVVLRSESAWHVHAWMTRVVGELNDARRLVSDTTA